jgi:hypothetical protein
MYMRYYQTKILFSLLVVIFLNLQAKAEKTILSEDLTDRLRGMWLGQLIGNYAGRQTEGWFKDSSPNTDPCVPWVIKHPNDLNGWDADDDTDIEYIAIHILETNGLDCNSEEITDP